MTRKRPVEDGNNNETLQSINKQRKTNNTRGIRSPIIDMNEGSISLNRNISYCQGGCTFLYEDNKDYCLPNNHLYKKHCVTWKKEITKELMKKSGTIKYCKQLYFDNIPEYKCSFVQCLTCEYLPYIMEQEEQRGRTTRSRQTRAV